MAALGVLLGVGLSAFIGLRGRGWLLGAGIATFGCSLVSMAVTAHRCRGVFGGDVAAVRATRSGYCAAVGLPAFPSTAGSVALWALLFAGPTVLVVAVVRVTAIDSWEVGRLVSVGLVGSGAIALISFVLAFAAASNTDMLPAPPTGAFPVASGVRIAATSIGGSVFGEDPKLFRTIDLTSDRYNALGMLRAEIALLQARRWRGLRITKCCHQRAVDGGVEGTSFPAVITDPGAAVDLNSPDGSWYVDMQRATGAPVSVCGTRTCGEDPVADRLIRAHRPVLVVTFASTNQPPPIPQPGS